MKKQDFSPRKPLFLVVVSFFLAAAIGAALPVSDAFSPKIPLAPVHNVAAEVLPPPAPRLSSLDVCFGIDDSGSEYGPDGNDPGELRYAASRSAVAWLEGVKAFDQPNRVAVSHFGSSAPPSLTSPLVTITSENLPAIGAALVAPPEHLGATDIAAVIARCQELLGAPDTSRNQAILIFTDGEPSVGQVSSSDLFAEIDAQIRQRAEIPVTVIRQVSQNDVDAEITEAWKRTAVRALTTLPAGGDLEHNLGKAMVDTLAQQIGVLPAASRLDGQNPVTTMDVPPYTPRMGITLFSPADVAKLEIVDPHGNSVHVLAGRANVWNQERPAAGQWKLRLLQGASADVQADIVPLQVEVVEPESEVPVGRAMQVTLRLGSNETLTSLQGTPLYVGASIATASGTYVLAFEQHPDGLWRSTESVPVQTAGRITLRALVKAGTATVIDSTESIISAVSRPYLVVENPTAATGDDFRFSLHLDGKPVSAEVLGQDPRAAVTASLPEDQSVTGDGIKQISYNGTNWVLPATQTLNGRTLSAVLSSRLVDGTSIRDTVTYSAVVNDPQWLVRATNGARALLVAGAVLTIGAALWLIWLLVTTRSRLKGSLIFPSAGAIPARRIRVDGRRWHRAPGHPLVGRRLIWSQNGPLRTRTGLFPWPFDSRELGRDEAYLAVRQGGRESSFM